jgi:N-formylglutamate amidohydrolase
MTALIFHIPHAATLIPPEVRAGICLADAELAEEIRILTDHHTDHLFEAHAEPRDIRVVFPFSRLVTDVERYPDDDDEPMAKSGMGAVYVKGHAGAEVRRSLADREELMKRYYEPHHQKLEAAVRQHLARTGWAFILDCHSFPERTLPCQADQSLARPEICLGTDPFHTPEAAVLALEHAYRSFGYEVGRNTPYAGAIVPLAFYGRDTRVKSVMIELRRDLYMDEETGALRPGAARLQQATAAAVAALRTQVLMPITG